VTRESAQTEMSAIASRLEARFPDVNRGKSVRLVQMRNVMAAGSQSTVYLLLGASALVLLTTTANLANLLLCRLAARRREIAVRLALGARRSRIICQLMTENLLLALAGGFAGLLPAYWGSRALITGWPGDVPLIAQTAFDGRVLAFVLALSLAAAVLFGLVPAILAVRIDSGTPLNEASPNLFAGSGISAMQGYLVSLEAALAVILLTSAGLFLRSLISLGNVSLGYAPKNVISIETSVPAADLNSARRASCTYKELLSRLAASRGVVAAGAIRILPGHVASFGPWWTAGRQLVDGDTRPGRQAVYSIVAPHTFAALGIPLLKGRDFDSRDIYDAPFVAVINEKLARTAFPCEDPVGRVIHCSFDSKKPMTIVGVVGDVKEYGPARAPSREIYMPYEQHPLPASDLHIVVRSAKSPDREVKLRLLSAFPPGMPARIETMDEVLARDGAVPRFRAELISAFALMALFLAAAGVHGVTSYAVKRRSSEIALRAALGARPGSIIRLVLRQALALIAIGIAAGMIGSVPLTRLFGRMLFEVKAVDPPVYLCAVVLLLVVSLLAGYIPARRAAFGDPAALLRHL